MPDPPPKEKTVKALVFDAYGTLFDLESLVPYCTTFFGPSGADLCRLWRAKQLEYTYLLTLMGRYEDFWLVTVRALVFACQSLGFPCPRSLQEELLERYFHLEAYPDVEPALEALGDFPLAILSNGSPRMLQAAVEHNGLQRFFPRIISTSEVKSYKPDPLVYQWAAQRLGQPVEGMGLVAGNTWDVIGAESCGFWGAWIKRVDTPWDDLGFAPDATVTSLTELAAILLSPD